MAILLHNATPNYYPFERGTCFASCLTSILADHVALSERPKYILLDQHSRHFEGAYTMSARTQLIVPNTQCCYPVVIYSLMGWGNGR